MGTFYFATMSMSKSTSSMRSSSKFVHRLLHQHLVKDKSYVDGQWISAQSGKMFDVYNPSDGKKIGSVADLNDGDTDAVVSVAKKAFDLWKKTTAKERSNLLRRWFELIIKNQNELAELLTTEQGKPLSEAKTEVLYGASFVEWYSEEARRIHGDVVQSPNLSKEMLFIRQPIGVVGLITPWNFPNAMLTRKAAAALAAGCTCIAKPAEDTPYSALALAQVMVGELVTISNCSYMKLGTDAHEANIPPGVFNVVTSSRENSPKVGKVLCNHPQVAGISFTGSTAVGKILYQQCASTVKRLSLELGGNAPFIVFESGNVDAAVEGAIACKFRCTGQTCVSANRFLVQAKVYDEFVTKLTKRVVETLVVGDGFEPKTTQGPLANKQQAVKVDGLVRDAVSKGAVVVTGGKPHPKGELFYQPTIITNVNNSMKISIEEIFGPVASVVKFDTEEEGLKMANSTNTGLAGYFYSQDIAQIWRVAKGLETGMVGINESILSAAEAAFGGVKESGLGREGSKYGIDEFTELKYLCFGGLH